MEIGKQISAAQERANQLAIQEMNLREQIGPLEAQLEQIVRAKHQAIGAVSALMKVASETHSAPVEPPAPTVIPKRRR